MSNPLISIIVPIYGIERYVGLCIESIIKQTYKNIEIILVDDGSPDRCPEICDLYAKKDNRIKVIHKQNGGLVSARKAGLLAASGEFVGYVDGDDSISPDYYESLFNAIGSSDIVAAGQSRDLFYTSSEIKNPIPSGRYTGKRLDTLKKNMLSFGDFSGIGVTTYVWNKLFVREKLLKYQLSVDDKISIGEDAAVTYPYLMDCQSVCIIDNCGYHYRQREDSMLKKSTPFEKEAVGLKKLYDHLSKSAENQNSKYEYQKQIDDFVLGICIMRSGGILKELQEEYSPYNREFYGKNIVLYSAGTFGQQLANRIKENNYCNIVGWVDVDFWEYRRCCLDVDPIESVDDIDFDYILIATVNGENAKKVKSAFVWRGVDSAKILTVNCPEENRRHLLKRYLSL